MGISYPTVRSKLDQVIRRLGYDEKDYKNEEEEKRESVLKALEQGEITAKDALDMLK